MFLQAKTSEQRRDEGILVLNLRGNLHDNVSDIEDTEKGVEFPTFEIEVLLETTKPRCPTLQV